MGRATIGDVAGVLVDGADCPRRPATTSTVILLRKPISRPLSANHSLGPKHLAVCPIRCHRILRAEATRQRLALLAFVALPLRSNHYSTSKLLVCLTSRWLLVGEEAGCSFHWYIIDWVIERVRPHRPAHTTSKKIQCRYRRTDAIRSM